MNIKKGNKMIKLNETPVRTARNFNINNIKLEDIEFPQEIKEFKNAIIYLESSKDKAEFVKTNINLTYGLGETFYKQVTNNSNYDLKIDINSKMKNLITLDFNFDANNLNLIENIYIEAKENTKSTIIIKYKASENLKCFHNGIIKLKADEKSEVNMVFVNFLNTNSNNFIAMENEILEGAKLILQL